MKASLLYLNIGYYLLARAAVDAACSSCLVSSLTRAGSLSVVANGGKKHSYKYRHFRHHQHHHNHRLHSTSYPYVSFGDRFALPKLKSDAKAVLMYIALRQLSTHFGHNIFTTNTSETTSTSSPYSTGLHLNTREHRHQHGYNYQRFTLAKSSENTNKAADEDDRVSSGDKEQTEQDVDAKDNVVSASMVGAIGIYKNFISPLLPPACRFFPTCSQYGVQAIEEFGPSKGVVLTAWRLMRCTPFGGKGYDPPKWPPVSYTYGSY